MNNLIFLNFKVNYLMILFHCLSILVFISFEAIYLIMLLNFYDM